MASKFTGLVTAKAPSAASPFIVRVSLRDGCRNASTLGPTPGPRLAGPVRRRTDSPREDFGSPGDRMSNETKIDSSAGREPPAHNATPTAAGPLWG
jgi:hypothetical protein